MNFETGVDGKREGVKKKAFVTALGLEKLGGCR